MVGRARVELATSRLSGVRSNHLSYRPIIAMPELNKGQPSGVNASSGSHKLKHLPKETFKSSQLLQKMKGHEDDGNVS
jgi:hypothetical protein